MVLKVPSLLGQLNANILPSCRPTRVDTPNRDASKRTTLARHNERIAICQPLYCSLKNSGRLFVLIRLLQHSSALNKERGKFRLLSALQTSPTPGLVRSLQETET